MAKFCGDRSTELGDRVAYFKKKHLKHRPPGTTVPGGLTIAQDFCTISLCILFGSFLKTKSCLWWMRYRWKGRVCFVTSFWRRGGWNVWRYARPRTYAYSVALVGISCTDSWWLCWNAVIKVLRTNAPVRVFFCLKCIVALFCTALSKPALNLLNAVTSLSCAIRVRGGQITELNSSNGLNMPKAHDIYNDWMSWKRNDDVLHVH